MKQLTFIIAKHGSLRAPCRRVVMAARIARTSMRVRNKQSRCIMHAACTVFTSSVPLRDHLALFFAFQIPRSHPIMASSLSLSMSGFIIAKRAAGLICNCGEEGDALKVDGARNRGWVELQQSGLMKYCPYETNPFFQMNYAIFMTLPIFQDCVFRINCQITKGRIDPSSNRNGDS